MVELAEACRSKNLLEQNADTLWLLALLSSNVACSKSLYYALPSIVDFLHQSSSNNFSNTTLVCILIHSLEIIFYFTYHLYFFILDMSSRI